MSRTIRDVIIKASERLIWHQRTNGCFSFCCEVSPLPDAMMVILLCLLGEARDASERERLHGLCTNLLHTQNEDGSWTAYEDQSENVSATVLALFALRLFECGASDRMAQAKDYILAHGGVERTSNLTKIVLAIAGEIPWFSLPHGHIEFILLGKSFPVSIYDLSSYARLHFVSFMVLSHLRYHYRVPDGKGVSDLFREGPPNSMGNIKLYIPIRNEPALKRCEDFIVDRLEPNGTLASYTSATVFAIAALQALGYPAHHPLIRRCVVGLRQLAYPRARRLHQQLFSSTVWDTALSLQALEAAQAATGFDATGFIEHGAKYLLSKQHTAVGDWGVHAPGLKPGGWGFSHVNTLYPDLDDTAAVLKALYPFRRQFPSQWKRGTRWLTSMQNDDGGFAAFERNNNKGWLKHIPINDMGTAMIDPSTPDLTGRVLDALGHIRLTGSIAKTVNKAKEWLLRNQREDGSWYGRWGICYIYGTWAAAIGLRASGLDPNHLVLQKALHWFESVQNQNGGFGESCNSDEANGYVARENSTPSQTAWGLMGMMAASRKRTPHIDLAADYLVQTSRPGGGWRETYPTGTGLAGQAYIRYHSYPYVWPVLALSQYLHLFGER